MILAQTGLSHVYTLSCITLRWHWPRAARPRRLPGGSPLYIAAPAGNRHGMAWLGDLDGKYWHLALARRLGGRAQESAHCCAALQTTTRRPTAVHGSPSR